MSDPEGSQTECDECGADGVELLCICGPKPTKTERAPIPQPIKGPTPRRTQPHMGGEGPHHRAPQLQFGPPVKVVCCRCQDVHYDVDRVNEWGKPAGKVMAGRRTECPKGCGYHVTIPYDPISCSMCGSNHVDEKGCADCGIRW